ncbi:hypothetical protein [Bradyrhizobium sp. USDA 4504]
MLADAKENENSLTRLLEANNIKYKDRNGQVITLNQLLTIAGGLLNKFDSIPEKTKAAQMLGLSEGWVEALRNGSKSFEEIAQSADAAGAVIDGATVAKAAAFDRAWQRSSAQLAAQFKSTAADIAGWLDDLIDKAGDLAKKALEAQNIQPGSGQEKFNRWADTLAIFGKDAVGATQDVDQLTSSIENLQASSKPENLQVAAGLEVIRAKAQLAADMRKSVAEQQSKAEFPNGVPTPTSRPAAADNANPNAAHPPKRKDGEEAADAYDRATEFLNKYIVTTNALAESQGKGAAATEEAKAESQLLNAAQLAGIPITQKVRDQIQDLAQDAGEAADALAKAKVASDIQFGAKTAFLSPQDLAIAQQLKGIYGNDIPAALASSEVAGLRFNATIKDLANLGQQVNSSFLVDFETQIRNGASAMDALKTAGLNALGKIADKLAQMAVDNLWSSAFGGSGGGLGGLFSGLLGGSSGPTGSITVDAQSFPKFASGTDSAPGGLSLVGENGPELMNVPRGVVPNDVLRNGGVGGGIVTVHGGSVYIQGDASEKTVALINQALARQNAELPMRVVAAVKDAKARRVLA